MSYYNLHEIYKDLYFHELDTKEKITNRVQLTFAFHITIMTILAYMLRTVDYNSSDNILISFYAAIVFVFIFLGKSFYETVKAFWGNTYMALASAQNIEDYRHSILQHKEEIEEYKTQFPDKKIEEYPFEEKIGQYIYNEYTKCATHNSSVNDTRSQRNHLAIKYILFSMIPFLLVCVCFIGWDMDASSPRKELLIEYGGIQDAIKLLQSDNSVTLLDETIRSVIKQMENEAKEIAMTQEDMNRKPTINETPPPPKPPEPPKPRDLVKEERPPISAENGSEK